MFYVFKEKLGYLEGGTDTLLQALKEAIVDNGGEFYLSTPVKEIIIEHNRVIGINVGNDFKSFTKIFSTAPLPYIPKLLPNISKDLLQNKQFILLFNSLNLLFSCTVNFL